MATLVGIISVVVNVGVSFMTDGNWKTAGTGLAQFYWDRANQRSYSGAQARGPLRARSFCVTWSLARSGVRTQDGSSVFA
ncbi:MAG: hypothetical protein ACJ746_00755 [Bryobacteraceae bacterium]